MHAAALTRQGRRALVCLVFASGAARAEPLTLDAALTRARSASPEVVVAARRLAEAEASRVGQGVPFTNPRLIGDYRWLAKEQPGTPSDPFHGYNVAVNGEVEVSGASGARLDEARRRVDVALAELEAARVNAAASAWRAWVDLQVAERLVASALELEPVPDSTTALTRALEKRPELAALRARVDLLTAADARLVREAVPKLGLNLGFDGAPASPVFGYAGLFIDLPVAQRNQGPRAVAHAQRETERALLDAAQRRVGREVTQALADYASLTRALALLTEQALPNAERTQALVEEGWRAGRFDVFRLTTATRELLRVRRERLETLTAAWHARVELERVSGGLAP